MKPLISTKCPFKKLPETNQPATWLKPSLICEIKFTEWTSGGLLRHPVFRGLRYDLKKNEIHKEPVSPEIITNIKK